MTFGSLGVGFYRSDFDNRSRGEHRYMGPDRPDGKRRGASVGKKTLVWGTDRCWGPTSTSLRGP